MNYKFIPLLAVMLMMVVAPTPNVFGVLSNEMTIADINNNGIELGNIDPYRTPLGMKANADGNFLSYRVTDSNIFEQWLFFQKTTNGGISWSSPLNVTGVQNSGFGYGINQVTTFANATTNTVDILWVEEVGGSTEGIMHIRSTDNGDSFGSPTVIVSGFTTNQNVWFDVNGDDVFAFYWDQSSSEGRFAGSYDGGATFPTNASVFTGFVIGAGNPYQAHQNFVMKTGGGGTGSSSYVWVAFSARSTDSFGTIDVFTAYSIDGGGAWTTPIIVSAGAGDEGTAFQTHLFVDYVADDVLIIFQGSGGGGTAYLSQAYSANNGVSFTAQENIELGIVCQWDNAVGSQSHVVSYDGTNIQAICQGDGGQDVMQSVSTDFGDNWASFQSIINSGEQDAVTDTINNPIIIKAVGDRAFATWEYSDSSNTNQLETAYSFSDDAGSTWTSANIDDVLDGNGGFRNQLQGFDDIVYIVTEVFDTLYAWFENFNAFPVISVNGDQVVDIDLLESYVELGATCTDAEDGSLSVVQGGDTVNIGVSGFYTVTYDCEDSAGQDASQGTRVVRVGVTQTSGTLYACEQFNGNISQIWEINTGDGTASNPQTPTVDANGIGSWTGEAGNFISNCPSLATDPTDGQMYGYLKNDDNGNRYLATLDPTVPEYTLIGESIRSGNNFDGNSITFDAGGQMYIKASSNENNDLGGMYTIDKSTGVVTPNAQCNFPDGQNGQRQIALNHDDGFMYALNPDGVLEQLQLVQIDTSASDCIGTITVVSGDFGGGQTGDMTYDITTSEFYFNEHDSLIHMGTNAVTVQEGLFTVGEDAMKGMAFAMTIELEEITDFDNPTITLLGGNPDTMQVNGNYIEKGAICSDPTEGNIDGNIVTDTENIDNTQTGSNNFVLYDCQDTAGNDATQVSRQVVVQKSSQGISSGTTSGGDQGTGGTSDVLTSFDDVPPIQAVEREEASPTPLLVMTEDGIETASGQSITDIFANLFGQRLDSQTGQTVDTGSPIDTINSFFSDQGQPSDTGTSNQAGINIINVISNFFSNLFN